jgi:hypothetical protein
MLNSTFVYSNETPEGINKEEDFANGSLSLTDRLPVNPAAVDIIARYNTLRFPTSFVKRAVNTVVNRAALSRLVTREGKKWKPVFRERDD